MATFGSFGGSGVGDGVGAFGSGDSVSIGVRIGVGRGEGDGEAVGVGTEGVLVLLGVSVGISVGVGLGFGVLVGQTKANKVSSAYEMFDTNELKTVTEQRSTIKKGMTEIILFFLFFRLKAIQISQHLFLIINTCIYKMSTLKYNLFLP